LGAALVLVAAGVGIGLAVSGGGHSASVSSAPPAVAETPADGGSSSATAAAVTNALKHGVMNVVVDQPAEPAFGEVNRYVEQGAQIAAEETNAAGRLPGHLHIKLIPERLGGLAPSAVQERLRLDAAGVLVLNCDSNSQRTVAAAAASYGTLMLAPCNPEPAAAERYRTYWPVGSGANEEVAELATFMVTQGYLRAFVVSSPGLRYSELLTSYFTQAAKSHRISIAGSEAINPATADLTGLAQKIKGLEPQPSAVFTALPPPAVNHLGAALQAQGVTAAIVGTSVMDSRFTLASGASSLENAIFGSYGFAREGGAAQSYAKDYEKQFGKTPLGSLPGVGFETIRLLEEASRRAGSGEPSAIEHALGAGLTLPGVALADRHYRPGTSHNPLSEVGVQKITGHNFEPLIAGVPSGAPAP
jgi:ABC-type branched-subunit amino acid transport system substrate-binding protein